MDDDAIRFLVTRLGRAHPSGGTVIERAAITEGADFDAVMAWIVTHGGKPEMAVPRAARSGLHGSRRHDSGGSEPRTPSRLCSRPARSANGARRHCVKISPPTPRARRGVPDEASPVWTTLPPRPQARSSASAMSATAKYGTDAVSRGPRPRAWIPTAGLLAAGFGSRSPLARRAPRGVRLGDELGPDRVPIL